VSKTIVESTVITPARGETEPVCRRQETERGACADFVAFAGKNIEKMDESSGLGVYNLG
jgi:hypothetical protein